MSKEPTPLEAYNRLCSHLDYDNSDYMHNGSYEEDNEIIEKALKRLEEKEHNCEVYLKQINGLASKLAKYEKEHKALEIIAKKPMLTPCIFMHETYEEYIKEYGEWNEVKEDTCYTKEEFDLIKEVMESYGSN